MAFLFNNARVRTLGSAALDVAAAASRKHPCVVYWMNRDMRAEDNWALLHAHRLAEAAAARGPAGGTVPVVVCYHLPRDPVAAGAQAAGTATERQYAFLLGGLRACAGDLHAKHYPFHLLGPSDAAPEAALPAFLADTLGGNALALVTDMSPLRAPLRAARAVADAVNARCGIPVYQVDAHNVVPVWAASPKREYAARTIRPKLNRLLPTPVLQT